MLASVGRVSPESGAHGHSGNAAAATAGRAHGLVWPGAASERAGDYVGAGRAGRASRSAGVRHKTPFSATSRAGRRPRLSGGTVRVWRHCAMPGHFVGKCPVGCWQSRRTTSSQQAEQQTGAAAPTRGSVETTGLGQCAKSWGAKCHCGIAAAGHCTPCLSRGPCCCCLHLVVWRRSRAGSWRR